MANGRETRLRLWATWATNFSSHWAGEILDMTILNEQGLLQETDRHIAEGRARAIILKRQIADLQQRGHNAIGSMGLLRELEHSLRLMSTQRELIAR